MIWSKMTTTAAAIERSNRLWCNRSTIEMHFCSGRSSRKSFMTCIHIYVNKRAMHADINVSPFVDVADKNKLRSIKISIIDKIQFTCTEFRLKERMENCFVDNASKTTWMPWQPINVFWKCSSLGQRSSICAMARSFLETSIIKSENRSRVFEFVSIPFNMTDWIV